MTVLEPTQQRPASSDAGSPRFPIDALRIDSVTKRFGDGPNSVLALDGVMTFELGIPARPVLARSLLIADPAAAVPPQELDDFADALVELDLGAPHGKVFVDPRLRHAAFGYLPPGLDGARILTVPDGQFALDEDTVLPERLRIRLEERLAEPGNDGVLVVVRADTGVPFSTIRRTLDDARAAGAKRLAIATRQHTDVKP